jgi:hypothetical protein
MIFLPQTTTNSSGMATIWVRASFLPVNTDVTFANPRNSNQILPKSSTASFTSILFPGYIKLQNVRAQRCFCVLLLIYIYVPVPPCLCFLG